jgi:hypothetical protein
LTHGLVTFAKTGVTMPDYEEILTFLAANPPKLAAERELHASLLEMIARCLRSDAAEDDESASEQMQGRCIHPMDIN